MYRLVVVFVLLFGGCSLKNYEHVKSKIIIMKTQKLKFADLAYIRNSSDSIELELFVAGKVVKRIDINNFICIDEGCMRKSTFNEEYLSSSYPEMLFQNIILGKKIYNGKNLLYINGGFEQRIHSKDVDIKYIVNAKKIYFQDKRNGVLLKIKDVD